MTFYASPFQAQTAPAVPVPEQSSISLGPYNHEQAPHIECASCGTPITVGQRLTTVREWLLGIDTSTGQLALVPPYDFPEDSYIHSECSAEFCHDQITKEPCGKEEDEDGRDHCMGCGVSLTDSSGICDWCESKLKGLSP